jgi:hypothetical protein
MEMRVSIKNPTYRGAVAEKREKKKVSKREKKKGNTYVHQTNAQLFVFISSIVISWRTFSATSSTTNLKCTPVLVDAL